MDQVRAKHMSEQIIDQNIGGWDIKKFIGAGKSALVFQGTKNSEEAAIKIFDPELVERFGKKTQLKRIDRECTLIGQNHPNLVNIYGGGECDNTGYLFVAMQYISGRNLAEVISSIPRDKICSLIQQVASAALFLEQHRIVHRDIKPENIAINDDFTQAVLLDLGVIRPFGDSGITDEDGRVFVGTLRYSSPEFLLRKEDDSENGWRAITFYQLGAVLHDMIMRQPLFSEYSEPFALLVDAVKNVKAEIHATDVSSDLIMLAKKCLVKSPNTRLELVSWNDFAFTNSNHVIGSAKERVKRRVHSLTEASFNSLAQKITPPNIIKTNIAESIEKIIRDECIGNPACPPIDITKEIGSDIRIIVNFAASTKHKILQNLFVIFQCELIDEHEVAINIAISACLLQRNEILSKAPSQHHFYQGIFEVESLSEVIINAIWVSLDIAQQVSSSGITEISSKWLNIFI